MDKKGLQKQLLQKFNYEDPKIAKIRGVMTKFLGSSKSPDRTGAIADFLSKFSKYTTPVLRQITQGE